MQRKLMYVVCTTEKEILHTSMQIRLKPLFIGPGLKADGSKRYSHECNLCTGKGRCPLLQQRDVFNIDTANQ